MAKSKNAKKQIAQRQREMLLCPCCDTYRSLQDASALSALQQRFAQNGGRRDLVASARSRSFRWACDICLRSRRAVPGQPWLQVHCDWDPWAAFFDIHESCCECHADFVFTKEEQQYWYEELKFWVQSTPTRCKKCRRERRRRSAIHQHLADLHRSYRAADPAQSLDMTEYFVQLGNIPKAKLYLSRARNSLLKMSHSDQSGPLKDRTSELTAKIFGRP